MAFAAGFSAFPGLQVWVNLSTNSVRRSQPITWSGRSNVSSLALRFLTVSSGGVRRAGLFFAIRPQTRCAWWECLLSSVLHNASIGTISDSERYREQASNTSNQTDLLGNPIYFKNSNKARYLRTVRRQSDCSKIDEGRVREHKILDRAWRRPRGGKSHTRRPIACCAARCEEHVQQAAVSC